MYFQLWNKGGLASNPKFSLDANIMLWWNIIKSISTIKIILLKNDVKINIKSTLREKSNQIFLEKTFQIFSFPEIILF